jgi:hypothetical protein
MFKPRRLVEASVVAALAAGTLMSTTAMAISMTTFTNAAATYAIEAVTGASGAITIASNAQFAVAGVPAGAGSFLLTIALPTGVLFNGTPTVTGDGTVCVGTATPPSLGGNGQNSAQFTIGAPASNPSGTCTVTLNSFNVTGATALEMPSTQATPPTGTSSIGFNITAQASGASGSLAVVSTTAIKVALAASQDEILVETAGSVVGTVIDVNAPSLGTKWLIGGVPPDVALDVPGATIFGLTGSLNAAATGPFNLGGSSGTFVMTGNFSGIAAAFLSPGGCAPTAAATAGFPGAIAAALTSSSATFSGATGAPFLNPFVPPNPPVAAVICLYSGTSVIAANPPNTGAPAVPFGFSLTVGVGTAAANQTTPPSAPLGRVSI